MNALPVTIASTTSACCTPGQAMDDGTAHDLAKVFKALGDPTRVKLLSMIVGSSAGEMCVCDLTRIMAMTQPAVSHHLKQLRQARLVKYRRDGKATYYSLNDYHIQLLFDLCKTHLNETKD